ncbi:MAG: polysaccharide deacetylase family protein [Peptoniphilus sp.]|nr:polysaccharide deacetylase family protein [Peptoniphilus sp.]MDY3118281.1 polysaccharide deacetylase family protein [Peptoniphilus sp.]
MEKKTRQFNRLFLGIALFLLVSIAAFNVLTDPFNVFGDPIFRWFGYDFTQNPRTAKITYLKTRGTSKKYKNFIVGASGASSIPLDKLKAYTGKEYFNVFHYGADLYDTEKTVAYLLKNYPVESIIMPLAIPSATKYHENRQDLNYKLHPDVSGERKSTFYKDYLFANPRYGVDKIQGKAKDSYIPKDFDVFKEDGSYDKRVRDVEYMGSKEEYMKNLHFDIPKEKIPLAYADEALGAIERIRNMCDKRHVPITFILTPMYAEQNARYDSKEVKDYVNRLSSIIDFWDFTGNALEEDPRFFYDPSHFRNALGDMILDKIYKGEGNYGKWVSKGNVEEKAPEVPETLERSYYIFTFHHVAEGGDGLYTITPECFEAFLQFLEANHIQTVHFQDLMDFVAGKGELPEKFALITFDDGYASNLEMAYPLLKKYRQVATIFPIGKTMGMDRYPNTDKPMKKHFTAEEAKAAKDVFEYGSHSYFFHQSYRLEGVKFRRNMGRLKGEKESDFIADFRADDKKFKAVYKEFNDGAPYVFAYPQGVHDDLTEVLLTEEGYKVSVTSEEGKNYVVKYLPETLRRLKRVNVSETVDLEQFVQ